MDPFERVSVGEPLRGRIKAEAWNAMLECAADYRRGILGGAKSGTAPVADVPSLVVRVRNDTGAALDAGAILLTGASPIDVAAWSGDCRRRPLLAGTAPGATTDTRIVVTQEPIPKDAVGRAVIAGVAVCQVSGAGDYAVPVAGQTGYLTGAAAGPVRVLSRAGSGSQVAAMVLVGVGAAAAPMKTDKALRNVTATATCTGNPLNPVQITFAYTYMDVLVPVGGT